MALGAGAGLYFSLSFEPPLWTGWAAMAAGAAAAVLAFRKPWPLGHKIIPNSQPALLRKTKVLWFGKAYPFKRFTL